MVWCGSNRDWEMRDHVDGQKSQKSKKSKKGVLFLSLLIVVGVAEYQITS